MLTMKMIMMKIIQVINYIIDLSEEKNDKEYSLSESLRRFAPRSRFLHGHCPFNFFEKEKCKNIDFKKVNIRTYISNISAEWEKMSDKEKEPYVKLSDEFKNNYLAQISLDYSQKQKVISRKRRRKCRTIAKSNIDNNNSINNNNGNSSKSKFTQRLTNNKINYNNNNSSQLESFSIYTTNKYTKKKVNENNDNKNILIKNNSANKMNEYINSVLIPFLVKSFNFIKSLTNNSEKSQNNYN